MTMRIYTHPACLLHDTGPGHAEHPERLRAVLEALRAADTCLGEILAWRDAQPDAESIAVIVMSDHGHITGESRVGLINVRHTLDKAALPLMVERFAQLAETPGAPLPRGRPSTPFHPDSDA